MICPDCLDNGSLCLRCDGTGHLCDTCGESADPGAALCDDCQFGHTYDDPDAHDIEP